MSEASLQRVGEATLPSGPSSTHSSFVSEGFIIESAESFPVTSVVGGLPQAGLEMFQFMPLLGASDEICIVSIMFFQESEEEDGYITAYKD